ncbi:MAG: helix-turn-helix domain-containing protein [Bernardetiaceae bacterium]|nr:helix-turn-helix domain-containing protein [Bernardetiaceae bacterium]
MSISALHASIPELVFDASDLGFAFKKMSEISAHTPTGSVPHRHHYYSIIWIRAAEGTHYIDFQAYPIRKDTIYFIAPEQVHHLAIESDCEPEGYVLLFTRDFLQQQGLSMEFLQRLGLFFNCDEMKMLRVGSESLPSLLQSIEGMQREQERENIYQKESIAAWLRLFLICCKRLSDNSLPEKHLITTTQSQLIRKFKNLIEKHYQKLHKVSDYAELLHLSSNYLNEVVKSETGKSAKKIIQNRLLIEAKRQALYSELSSKEIAFMLGFEDPAHFSKFFKKHQGESFSSFRQGIYSESHAELNA